MNCQIFNKLNKILLYKFENCKKLVSSSPTIQNRFLDTFPEFSSQILTKYLTT